MKTPAFILKYGRWGKSCYITREIKIDVAIKQSRLTLGVAFKKKKHLINMEIKSWNLHFVMPARFAFLPPEP